MRYISPENLFRDHVCWLCWRGIHDIMTNRRQSLCRVIFFWQAYNSVSVSGIGYKLHVDGPCGSLVVPRRQEGDALRMKIIPNRPIQDPRSPADQAEWAFSVHADCWDVVGCSTDNIEAFALTWCHALVSINWEFNRVWLMESLRDHRHLKTMLLNPPRDGGTMEQSSPGFWELSDLQALVDALEPDILLSGRDRLPLERFDIYPQLHKSATLLGPYTDLSRREMRRRDIFSTLPEEMLQQIFQYTQTADLLKLQLASRTVACVSRVETLPQRFWFSRFSPGFELGVALPSTYPTCRFPDFPDWRGMYFLIRRALRRPEAGGMGRGLSYVLERLMRRKYWASRFAPVLELHSKTHGSRSAKLLGEPFSWPFPGQTLRPTSAEHDLGLEWFKLRQMPTGSVIGAQFTRPDGKVRLNFTVSTDITTWPMEGIGISTVCLAGQVYISGLRFIYKDGGGELAIGYISGHSETVIRIYPGERFCGFDVCADNDGIRALSVVVRCKHSKYIGLKWIGHGEAEMATSLCVSVWIPMCPTRHQQRVAASFDHFRMIALGVNPGERIGPARRMPRHWRE